MASAIDEVTNYLKRYDPKNLSDLMKSRLKGLKALLFWLRQTGWERRFPKTADNLVLFLYEHADDIAISWRDKYIKHEGRMPYAKTIRNKKFLLKYLKYVWFVGGLSFSTKEVLEELPKYKSNPAVREIALWIYSRGSDSKDKSNRWAFKSLAPYVDGLPNDPIAVLSWLVKHRCELVNRWMTDRRHKGKSNSHKVAGEVCITIKSLFRQYLQDHGMESPMGLSTVGVVEPPKSDPTIPAVTVVLQGIEAMTPVNKAEAQVKRTLVRTLRWLQKSGMDKLLSEDPDVFVEDIKRDAETIANEYAIGGSTAGSLKPSTVETLTYTLRRLPVVWKNKSLSAKIHEGIESKSLATGASSMTSSEKYPESALSNSGGEPSKTTLEEPLREFIAFGKNNTPIRIYLPSELTWDDVYGILLVLASKDREVVDLLSLWNTKHSE
jgi:hypothetical protein